jgi:hypothetical protein
MHHYLQPALVFSANLRNGWAKAVAEAASHEVGHNFGLNHDGNASQAYDVGHAAWAPIMGVGYLRPLTQWSKGEYAGANNRQDDIAVIALNAPFVADDHGGTASTATALTPDVPSTGLISSAADEDWFSFTSLGGAVSVTVQPQTVGGDLDVSLQVLSPDGTVVATEAPLVPTPTGDATTAAGLGAVYSEPSLPAGVYLARVTAAGQGSAAGDGWSAYGSLGRYAITVTGSTAQPLAVVTAAMAEGTAGQPYSTRLSATGALGATSWSVPAGSLPPGLSLDTASGAISGRPSVARAVSVPVTVVDVGGRTVTRSVRLTVRAPVRVTTTGLARASRGRYYHAAIAATGGSGRAYWRLWSGHLPRGLTLSAAGVVSGMPRYSGTYTVTVRVADTSSSTVRAGHWAVRTYRLVVS